MNATRAADGLDSGQRASLRSELERLRRNAQAGVRRTEGELRGEDSDLFRDLSVTGDPGLAETEFERDVAGAGQARSVLSAIVAAERRLAEGDYGLCEDCGNAIGYARLEAQPTASRCVKCQELAEKHQGGRFHSPG
jgi:RNA polymerase-binding protein DksA